MDVTKAQIIELKKEKLELLETIGKLEYYRFSVNELVKGQKREIKRLTKIGEIQKIGAVVQKIAEFQLEISQTNRRKATANKRAFSIEKILRNIPEYA